MTTTAPSSQQYDENSFRKLFDAYVNRVHDYINAITHSHYLAEEVTQELFIILWRKRNDLKDVTNMDGYIFRIARNLVIHQLKQAAQDIKLSEALYKNAVAKNNEVQDYVNERSMQSTIEKAVAALPPQPQRVYILSRKHQMNFDEIAVEMGISKNTVKNHLNKALREIRGWLLREGYGVVVVWWWMG